MKVIIFGATGMIGHRMWAQFSKNHEVYPVLKREGLGEFKELENLKSKKSFYNVDVRDFRKVSSILDEVRPDLVLNCVGIVKQVEESRNAEMCIELNALFPHRLAKKCLEIDCRMIQFSTDCVFDGVKGSYVEADQTSATDIYGRSKALGEIEGLKNVITLRTSTIGRELNLKGGLFEWLLSQKNKSIQGFSRAIYSGFPSALLAHILENDILPNEKLFGIIHLSTNPIDKYRLAILISHRFDLNIKIEKNISFVMNRDLDCSLLKNEIGFAEYEWSEIIDYLDVDFEFYNNLRQNESNR